jgi:hypothetical protein
MSLLAFALQLLPVGAAAGTHANTRNPAAGNKLAILDRVAAHPGARAVKGGLQFNPPALDTNKHHRHY